MCFNYEVDGPTLHRTETRRNVRAVISCSECHCRIWPGESYLKIVGVWEGKFDTFRQCERCLVLLDAIRKVEIESGCRADESVPGYGGLFEMDGEDWERYSAAFTARGWHHVLPLVPVSRWSPDDLANEHPQYACLDDGNSDLGGES